MLSSTLFRTQLIAPQSGSDSRWKNLLRQIKKISPLRLTDSDTTATLYQQAGSA